MTQAISATGMKGFLQWLQQDQPAVYAAAAGRIAKAAPRSFSGFNGSVLRNIRLAQGRRSMALRGYGSLGCCSATCSSFLATVPTCSIAVAPNVGCMDTSCAANSGTTCSSSLTGVANIISAVSGAALNASEASTYNSLVSTQLARAQQGLPPLTLSSTAAGIPTIPGLTSGTSAMVLLGGAAVVLYLLFGRK
jgi:hypothetical protein